MVGKKGTTYSRKTQRDRAEEPDVVVPKKKKTGPTQIQKNISKQLLFGSEKEKKKISKSKKKTQEEDDDDDESEDKPAPASDEFVSLQSKASPSKKKKNNENNHKNPSKKKLSKAPENDDDDSDDDSDDLDFSLGDSDSDSEDKELTAEQLNAPSRVIYLSRLPFGLFEDQLESFFKQFGPVRFTIHPKTKANKSKHFAFVIFRYVETAEVAHKALHGTVFDNHVMQCKNLTRGEWRDLTLKAKKKRHNKKVARQQKGMVPKATLHRKKVREMKRKKKFETLGIDTNFLTLQK